MVHKLKTGISILRKDVYKRQVLLPELQEEPETSHKVVIGYLPAHDFDFDAQFDNIHWEYLTHINVSFAHVKSDGTLNTDKVPENKLRQIRTKAKEHGVKVLISLNKNSNGEFAAAIDLSLIHI